MPIYAPAPTDGVLRQGEVLSNVVEARLDVESLRGDAGLELEEKVHPLAIVVSQDCDLDWDYKARKEADPETKAKLANKLIPNILLCELWFADQLKGDQDIKSDLWRRIRNNMDERYHVLPPVPAEMDLKGEGFSALAIDFKRVFTVRTEELYFRLTSEAQRRSMVLGLFMQDLSTRFGYYQLRVPLPVEAAPVAPVAPVTPQA